MAIDVRLPVFFFPFLPPLNLLIHLHH